MSIPKFALPGDSLAPSSSHTPGSGSHMFASTIHASLAGPVTSAAPSKKIPPTISINAPSTTSAALPSVGDVVLGRVTRTNPRQATLDIVALGPTGSHVLHEPFTALIRQQDIRATEIDKVKVSESFRVGDVVRAVVISLGHERAYYCSTAKNEFGVVFAESESGEVMAPVSWKEMKEVGGAGRVESRKVAKPV